MELNANIPSGPIEQAWENHRFEMKLVNPANKRRRRAGIQRALLYVP
jgi:succinate dehydrogenase / fumarate reductase flavoprotein subunit